MNIFTRLYTLLSFILIVITSFLYCTLPSYSDGTSTGNPQVVGFIYMQDGAVLKPVENATVDLIQSDASPDTAKVITVFTDGNGFYIVPKNNLSLLKDYNVFAEKKGQKGYKNEAFIVQDTISIDTVPPIVLNSTGSITGLVLLMPPHSNDMAIILLTGTNLYFRPNVNGLFTIDSLAPGDYPIHIIAEPDGYTPYDTVFTIQPGISDTLSDTIMLEYNNVPPVEGFTLNYDTTLMLVKLSWNRSNNSIVNGYLIYRAKKGEPLKLLDSSIIIDTFYNDDVSDYSGDTLIYSITATDSNQNESVFSNNVTIIAHSRLILFDSIVTGKPYLYFANKKFIGGDTIIYAYEGWDFDTIYRLNKEGKFLSSYAIGTNNDVYLSNIDSDKYGNIFLHQNVVNDSIYIKKYSSSFSFICEVTCTSSSVYGDSTSITVNPEGYVFFQRKPMESYESYIYKYSPSLTLENTWETTDDILYNVQVTTDTLIIHIWQYKNNIGRGDLIVKYYDLNFNLLKTSNVSDLLNQQGFIVHDLNSFILLNNGYAAVFGKNEWENREKVFIIDSNNEIYLRSPISRGSSILVDNDLNIYSILTGNILRYKVR